MVSWSLYVVVVVVLQYLNSITNIDNQRMHLELSLLEPKLLGVESVDVVLHEDGNGACVRVWT